MKNNNYIASIEKQLNYLEKRATKDIKEVSVTREKLPKDVVEYYQKDIQYKIVYHKESFLKGYYTITRYVRKDK